MPSQIAENQQNQCRTIGTNKSSNWKKTLAATLQALEIIPEKFNGRVLVTMKDGGISYLEKSETLK